MSCAEKPSCCALVRSILQIQIRFIEGLLNPEVSCARNGSDLPEHFVGPCMIALQISDR